MDGAWSLFIGGVLALLSVHSFFKDRSIPEDDEVILCVRYRISVDFIDPLVAATFLLLIAYGSYHYLPQVMEQGEYDDALLLAACLPTCLACAIDQLFTKHILFYRDRIVKVWHLLGQRTIPYKNAKLAGDYRRWVSWYVGDDKSISLYEVDEKGKHRLIHIPIYFLKVPKETRGKVEIAISYLVGVEVGPKLYEKSRRFVKSELPKEVLLQ